jgi:hypothetical protein
MLGDDGALSLLVDERVLLLRLRLRLRVGIATRYG